MLEFQICVSILADPNGQVIPWWGRKFRFLRAWHVLLTGHWQLWSGVVSLPLLIWKLSSDKSHETVTISLKPPKLCTVKYFKAEDCIHFILSKNWSDDYSVTKEMSFFYHQIHLFQQKSTNRNLLKTLGKIWSMPSKPQNCNLSIATPQKVAISLTMLPMIWPVTTRVAICTVMEEHVSYLTSNNS